MEFITGKHISRRTLLRGMGASMGLPLLDAMIPARRLWASSTAAAATTGTRLVCIEQVHGAAGCNDLGASMNLWSPKDTGSDFDLSPTSLSSLEPFRDYLTIISDTDSRMADAFAPEEIGGDHFRTSAVFLTQAHPKQTEGSDVYSGVSFDQLFAQRFGRDTPIPSMQLSIEHVDQASDIMNVVHSPRIGWGSNEVAQPWIRSWDQYDSAGYGWFIEELPYVWTERT